MWGGDSSDLDKQLNQLKQRNANLDQDLANERNKSIQLKEQLDEVKKAEKEWEYKLAKLEAKASESEEGLRKKSEAYTALTYQQANLTSSLRSLEAQFKQEQDENKRLNYELEMTASKTSQGANGVEKEKKELQKRVRKLEELVKENPRILELEQQLATLRRSSTSSPSSSSSKASLLPRPSSRQSLIPIVPPTPTANRNRFGFGARPSLSGPSEPLATSSTNRRTSIVPPSTSSNATFQLEKDLLSSKSKLNKLERELSDSLATISALEKKLSETNNALDGSQHDFQSATSTLSSLTLELNTLKAKSSKSERELLQAQNRVISLEKEIERVKEVEEDKREEMRDEVEREKSRVEEVKRSFMLELEGEKKGKWEMEGKLERVRKALEEKEEIVRGLEERLESGAGEEEITKLRTDLEAKQVELAASAQALEAKQVELDALATSAERYGSLQAEMDALKATVEEKEASIVRLEEELIKTKEDTLAPGVLAEIRKELETATSSLKKTEELVKTLKEELDASKTTIEEKEKIIDRLEDETAKLKEDATSLDELRSTLVEKEAQLVVVSSSVADLQSRFDVEVENVKKLTNEIAVLENSESVLESRKAELETIVKDLEKTAQDVKGELEERSGELLVREQEIEGLKKSLVESEERAGVLESRIEADSKELSEREERVTLLEDLVGELERRVQEGEIGLQDVEKEKEAKEVLLVEMDDLERALMETRDELRTQVDLVDRKSLAVVSLEKDLNTSTKEMKKLQNDFDNLTKALAVSQANTLEVEEKLVALEAESAILSLPPTESPSPEMEADLHRHAVLITRLREERTSLQEELEFERTEARFRMEKLQGDLMEIARTKDEQCLGLEIDLGRHIDEVERLKEELREMEGERERNEEVKVDFDVVSGQAIELAKEVEVARDTIEDLQEELKVASEKVQETTIQLEEANAANAGLKSDIGLLESHLAKASASTSAAPPNVAELNEKIVELEARVLRRTVTIGELTRKLEAVEYDSEASVATVALDDLPTPEAAIDLRQDLVDAQSRLATTEAELKSAQTAEAAIRSEFDATLIKHGALVDSLQASLDVKTNECHALVTESHELAEEQGHLRQQAANLETTLATMTSDLEQKSKDHLETMVGFEAASRQVQSLQQELERLSADRSARETEELSSLEEKLASAIQQHAASTVELESSLTAVTEQLTEREAALLALQPTFVTLEQALATANSERAALATELKAFAGTQRDQEGNHAAEIASLSSQLQNVNEEKAALGAQLQKVDGDLIALREESCVKDEQLNALAQVQEKAQELEALRTIMESTITSLESQLSAASQVATESKASYLASAASLAKLHAQVPPLRAQVADLEAELADANAEKERLAPFAPQVEILEKRSQQLQKDLDAARRDLTSTDQSASQELADLRSANTTLEHTVSSLKSETTSLQSQLDSTTMTHEELSEKLDAAESIATDLSARLDSSQSAKELLQREIQQLRKIGRANETEAMRLRGEMEELEGRLQRTQEEKTRLGAAYRDLETAASEIEQREESQRDLVRKLESDLLSTRERASADFERVLLSVEQHEKLKAEADQRILDLESELDRVASSAGDVQTAQRLAELEEELKEVRENLEERSAEAEDAEEKYLEVLRERKRLQATVERLKLKINTLQNDYNTAKVALTNAAVATATATAIAIHEAPSSSKKRTRAVEDELVPSSTPRSMVGVPTRPLSTKKEQKENSTPSHRSRSKSPSKRHLPLAVKEDGFVPLKPAAPSPVMREVLAPLEKNGSVARGAESKKVDDLKARLAGLKKSHRPTTA